MSLRFYMYFPKLVLTIFLLLGFQPIFSSTRGSQPESPVEKGLASINRQSAEAHIEFLSDDALMGREAATHEGKIAGNYIRSYFKNLGLVPLDDNEFFQPFEAFRKERQKRARYQVHPDSIRELCNEVHQRLPLRNILVKITGENPDEYVVIGAHYDHLGFDPFLDGDRIYNGADDNASGVAAVLQIARAFKECGKQPKRTVIFALWDGEEKGLLGSEYFIQTWQDPAKIKGYLNFDMIGRNNDEANPQGVVYFYTESHPIFETWLRKAIKDYSLNLNPDYRAWDKPTAGSDNASFAKRDIPIIWYHTDGHPDYHLPSDHADKINWEKTVDITKAAFLNLWSMANNDSF